MDPSTVCPEVLVRVNVRSGREVASQLPSLARMYLPTSTSTLLGSFPTGIRSTAVCVSPPGAVTSADSV